MIILLMLVLLITFTVTPTIPLIIPPNAIGYFHCYPYYPSHHSSYLCYIETSITLAITPPPLLLQLPGNTELYAVIQDSFGEIHRLLSAYLSFRALQQGLQPRQSIFVPVGLLFCLFEGMSKGVQLLLARGTLGFRV